ncbi:MAG: diguanylate cyclase [Pseudomonadota bacterium]
MEKEFGARVFSQFLYYITRITFKEKEAREHWEGILEHRGRLTQLLGRDAGFRVSLCDYLVNLQGVIKEPLIIDLEIFNKFESFIHIDELTGLYNRRFLKNYLIKEEERFNRLRQPFSIILLDIDHFKAFNDKFGHLAGDVILRELADLVKGTVRSMDYVIRYGGEEFIVILPCANKPEASALGERVRRGVSEHLFFIHDSAESEHLTISVGVANFPLDAHDCFFLLQRADQAMYNAKKLGRNAVVTCSPEKRRFPRFNIRREALFRYYGKNGAFIKGATRNISLGGLLCIVPEPITAGRFLEVVILHVNNGTSLNLKAKAVRLADDPNIKNGFQLGLQLEFKSAEEQLILDRLISEEKKRSDPFNLVKEQPAAVIGPAFPAEP